MRPEEVSLCVLMHFFVRPPVLPADDGAEAAAPLSAQQVSRRLALFLLRELKNTGSPELSGLRQLCLSLQVALPGAAGQQLTTQLVATLQAAASPDDLVKLFEAFEQLLAPLPEGGGGVPPPSEAMNGIQHDSLFGLFLRRIRVQFASMPFDAVTKLHHQLQLQLAAALQGWEGRPPGSAPPGLRDRVVCDSYLAQRLKAIEHKVRHSVDRTGQLVGRSVGCSVGCSIARSF